MPCHPVGEHTRQALHALAPHAPQLAARIGVDPAPVDVRDAAQVRWLRACLWPHDHARHARFDRAVALAQRRGLRVQRCDDCAAAIEPWLDGLPADVLPVVFNSWVLNYFDKSALHTHVEFMRELVQRRGIAWLSAEGTHIVLGDAPAPAGGDATVGDTQLAQGSLWWLVLPGPAAAEATLLARSHPHGRWLQWLEGTGG